jgi:hypothetical protein
MTIANNSYCLATQFLYKHTSAADFIRGTPPLLVLRAHVSVHQVDVRKTWAYLADQDLRL